VDIISRKLKKKMYAILSVNTGGPTEQGQNSRAEEYICLWECSKKQRRGKLFFAHKKIKCISVGDIL
jgi:hypothetical protein